MSPNALKPLDRYCLRAVEAWKGMGLTEAARFCCK
jgi:hypothetical protein